jgi:hypothetical protein
MVRCASYEGWASPPHSRCCLRRRTRVFCTGELVNALVGVVSTNRGRRLRTRRSAGLPTAGGRTSGALRGIRSRRAKGLLSGPGRSFRHRQVVRLVDDVPAQPSGRHHRLRFLHYRYRAVAPLLRAVLHRTPHPSRASRRHHEESDRPLDHSSRPELHDAHRPCDPGS